MKLVVIVKKTISTDRVIGDKNQTEDTGVKKSDFHLSLVQIYTFACLKSLLLWKYFELYHLEKHPKGLIVLGVIKTLQEKMQRDNGKKHQLNLKQWKTPHSQI